MRGTTRNMAAIDPGPGYWQGNEHNLHAIYMFNEAWRPDLTQKWARWALTDRYDTGPDGLDGNDDGGATSSWYVFSSLGIYPMAGSDRWWIGALIVDSAVLDLGSGKTLTITANNQSARNKYVQNVTLNSVKLTESWVLYGALTAKTSNSLMFEMGPKPATGGGY